jgi:hypothetical protein
VAKKALDRFVLTTGEIPPGVEVLAAKEAVHVKTSPLPMLGSSTTKALP